MQRIGEWFEWLAANDQLLWWMAAFSLLAFIVSLMLIPWIIVRIPTDYFVGREKRRSSFQGYHPLVVTVLRVLRNVIALVLIAIGLLLLVLPGQGLLTIFLGMVIADFPGKHRLINWLVAHRSICRPLNWIRRRAGKRPLEMPPLHD